MIKPDAGKPADVGAETSAETSADVGAEFHRMLEKYFLTYRELKSVPVRENGEPMIGLRENFSGKVMVEDQRMREFTGDNIYVRQSVVERLEIAQRTLRETRPDCSLEVVYGYRHLDIQIAKFEAQKAAVRRQLPALDGVELDETVHRFSAVPEVAGHPTGGAVDLRLRSDNGLLVPMGTDIPQYLPESYVFSPCISREAWHNRQLLRACMLIAGFAPFDGEWWHFSFGDREWAKYHNKPEAVYSQIRFQSV